MILRPVVDEITYFEFEFKDLLLVIFLNQCSVFSLLTQLTIIVHFYLLMIFNRIILLSLSSLEYVGFIFLFELIFRISFVYSYDLKVFSLFRSNIDEFPSREFELVFVIFKLSLKIFLIKFVFKAFACEDNENAKLSLPLAYIRNLAWRQLVFQW